MEFLLYIGVLVVLCLVLFILWKIANEFYAVAQSKGYNDRKYFWYCFFLGMIGYLLVIALKDKKAGESKEFELPEL